MGRWMNSRSKDKCRQITGPDGWTAIGVGHTNNGGQAKLVSRAIGSSLPMGLLMHTLGGQVEGLGGADYRCPSVRCLLLYRVQVRVLHAFLGQDCPINLRPSFLYMILVYSCVHTVWSEFTLINLYGGTNSTFRIKLPVCASRVVLDRWCYLCAQQGAESSCFCVCTLNEVTCCL